MTLTPSLRRLALVLVAALGLAACDASEQNISWEPGNSLSIVGPYRTGSAAVIDDNAGAEGAPVYLPVYPGDFSNNTVYFYVRGFDSAKTYTWSVDGGSAEAIQGGEFAAVNLPERGDDPGPHTYTVTVSNGEISGSTTVTVVNPNLDVQLGRFSSLSTLVSALNAADLRAALAEEGPFTVLAPTNAAFLAALDADESGAIDEDEMPEDEVLESILLSHVIPQRLTALDITDGQTVTTLAGNEITFRVADGQITAELGGSQATVVSPSNVQVGNGVIHALDAVLLPAAE